jgi:uncharacterized protein (TIGR02145 family)
MAENLAYTGILKYNGKTIDFSAKELGTYYLNEPMYGKLYGRLYTWEEAKKTVPPGWHLPTKEEWDELSAYADKHWARTDPEDKNAYDALALKSKIGWNHSSNRGRDTYGFSALPGGVGYSDGNFIGVGFSGHWWSASEFNSYSAYYRIMNYDDEYASWDYGKKSYLFSVRCLLDDKKEAV